MYRCLHFNDDWDDDAGEWDKIYQDKKMCSRDDTAHHHHIFATLEDGFNKRWKECIKFGCWLTFDKSRIVGWYCSLITQGLDPKPIWTGATIHSLALTHGMLALYKVHVCMLFGGKTDGDLGHRHNNTSGIQKWVNLLDHMLHAFKGNGHCVTMDSAYMCNIMAMIGQDVWKINMLQMAQTNWTGADVTNKISRMKKGTYKSICWQHKMRPLCFLVWSDNALVKTLSNFHSPEILEVGLGVFWKKRDSNGKRGRHKKEVTCPSQMKDYCETFYLINKGNGTEASYDLGDKSHLHNWSPKLIFWLFNMVLNNAYKMYMAIMEIHSASWHLLDMGNAVRELMHELCQRGSAMRQMRAEHPSWLRDMTRLFGWFTNRKICLDIYGFISQRARVALPEVMAERPASYVLWKHEMKQKRPWCSHQSEVVAKQGRCCWDDCPGNMTMNTK